MLLDILFAITILWSLYFGYVNGPITVFLYIISMIVAAVAAMVFTPTVAQLLRETFVTESPYIPFLALVLTFVTVLSIMRIISNMAVNASKSGYVNMGVQGLGSILMALTYSFFFSTLMTFLIRDAQVLDENRLRESSATYKYIEKIPAYGKAFLQATTPFVDGFIEYINRSIAQLNNASRRPSHLTHPQTVDSLQLNDTIPLDLELDSLTVTPNSSQIENNQ